MHKDELWKIYVEKNPSFLTEGASFTVSGLRKFFDTTWDAAHAQGLENGKAIGADESANTPFGETMKSFFGGRVYPRIHTK